MASDFEKPNKVHTLFMNEVKDKMYPLPIEELYGVGRSSSKKLRELGINKIEDLANADYNILYKYFKNQTNRLINSAKGIDDGVVVVHKKEVEAISKSITTSHDLNSLGEIYEYIYPLVENVSAQLRNKNKYTTLVSVMLKDNNFKFFVNNIIVCSIQIIFVAWKR